MNVRITECFVRILLQVCICDSACVISTNPATGSKKLRSLTSQINPCWTIQCQTLIKQAEMEMNVKLFSRRRCSFWCLDIDKLSYLSFNCWWRLNFGYRVDYWVCGYWLERIWEDSADPSLFFTSVKFEKLHTKNFPVCFSCI